jgi:hypothetical protein
VPIVALALVLFIVVAIVVLIPISLVQRYRVGTSRQVVRGWLAALNVGAFALSTALYVVGLGLTRWEANPQALYYQPNRWLVLAIVATVTARVLYGFWRAWHTWGSMLDDTSWLRAAGAASSLGAGAVVLGYYLAYWSGIRRRFHRHRRSRLGSRREDLSRPIDSPGGRHGQAAPRSPLLPRGGR